jgi:caffeoyl-CoA O-methyltransferase
MTTLRKINAYCEDFTSEPTAVLKELERETHLNTLSPHMLSGHLQGQFLSLLSYLMKPETILEIGTFTGYAAICLASGLSEKGVLHTIEINPELQELSSRYFKKANLSGKIVQHSGDAFDIITKLSLGFDMVYIDAGKTDNARFYDLVFDKVNHGGLIIIDNVLWDGKVTGENHDSDTRIIHEFNLKIKADHRVEKIMLPVRDGLLIVRRLSKTV